MLMTVPWSRTFAGEASTDREDIANDLPEKVAHRFFSGDFRNLPGAAGRGMSCRMKGLRTVATVLRGLLIVTAIALAAYFLASWLAPTIPPMASP
jgi:hypothetical protein